METTLAVRNAEDQRVLGTFIFNDANEGDPDSFGFEFPDKKIAPIAQVEVGRWLAKGWRPADIVKAYTSGGWSNGYISISRL